jgi:hypothetical protein
VLCQQWLVNACTEDVQYCDPIKVLQFSVVGQCGNQIGGAFWPLVLREHGIETQKECISKLQSQHIQPNRRLLDAFHSFFLMSDGISVQSFKTLADLENAKVRARVSLCHM